MIMSIVLMHSVFNYNNYHDNKKDVDYDHNDVDDDAVC